MASNLVTHVGIAEPVAAHAIQPNAWFTDTASTNLFAGIRLYGVSSVAIHSNRPKAGVSVKLSDLPLVLPCRFGDNDQGSSRLYALLVDMRAADDCFVRGFYSTDGSLSGMRPMEGASRQLIASMEYTVVSNVYTYADAFDATFHAILMNESVPDVFNLVR